MGWVALPGNINTITVTGTLLTPLAADPPGSVTFTPTSSLADRTGQVIVTAQPVRVTLVDGAFSVVLPCTDNDALVPNPFMYQVVISVPYVSAAPFTVLLPSTLGPTVDLSALAPNPVPATPTAGIYVSQVNGQSGAVTVTQISGVTVTGTPAAGQVLTATGPATATWQTPT